MKKFVTGFKAWIETRNIPQRRLSDAEIETLKKAMSFEHSIKSAAHIVWRIFIDLCAVVAAVFGVLAYFKQ